MSISEAPHTPNPAPTSGFSAKFLTPCALLKQVARSHRVGKAEMARIDAMAPSA